MRRLFKKKVFNFIKRSSNFLLRAKGLQHKIMHSYHTYNSLTDMVIIFEQDDNKIIDCNDLMYENLGYNRQELMQLASWKKIYLPDCDSKVEKRLQIFVNQGYQYNIEVTLQKKNGEQFPAILHITLLKEYRGKKNHVLAIYQDKGSVHFNGNKLEKTNEELHKRNEELNTLLHLITHDIKSPLRGISLISQWLMEDEYHNLSENSQRYLKSLKQRVRRA